MLPVINLKTILDSGNIDQFQNICVSAKCVGNYNENISIRLVDKTINTYNAYLKVFIEVQGGLKFINYTSVLLKYNDCITIVLNTQYDQIPSSNENLASLCQVANNIIECSNESLLGEFIFHESKVIHVFKIDLGPDISRLSGQYIHDNLGAMVSIVIRSSAVFAGLIELKTCNNKADIYLRYSYD